jgi:hypothetical protein
VPIKTKSKKLVIFAVNKLESWPKKSKAVRDVISLKNNKIIPRTIIPGTIKPFVNDDRTKSSWGQFSKPVNNWLFGSVR